MADRSIVAQFIRFAMIGVLNTFNSSAVYLLLTRPLDLHPLVANAIAFVFAASISYVLNKYWTFRDLRRAHGRQYPLFILVGSVGLLMSETILWLLHSRLGVHDYVAFLGTVVVVMFWNFGANRWITFQAPRETRSN